MDHAAIDARSLPPGTSLGKFALGKRIARGGMAELYLARADGRDGFEKLVALKLVLPQYKDDAQFLAMLRNEARLAAALEHPNIASVYDLGSDKGEHFIAMEYVHGRSVAEVLTAAEGPLPLPCALSLVIPASDAVQHAHDSRDARGRPQVLVHRDISPSNVLVRYDGVVKLVDFGIAKATAHTRATQTGTVKGKIGYMSPEQCLGGDLDRRTDVFALGVLLYELTVGQRLFVGGSDFSVMNRIISGEYARPTSVMRDYPVELEGIVERALASDRAERYDSAAQFRSELLQFAKGADLDWSPSDLERWLADHFDVPPTPVVSAEVAKAHRASGVGRRVLPYVAVASVAGFVGFLYRPAATDPDPLPSPPASVADARPDEDPVAAPPPQPRAPVEPPVAEDVPSPQEKAPEAKAVEVPAEASDEPPVPVSKPRPRRKTATSRKSKRPSAPKPKPEPSGDNSLLPPSMRAK